MVILQKIVILAFSLLFVKVSQTAKNKTTLAPGTWNKWGPWDQTCSKTCGIGVRRRIRTCSYRGRIKAKRCKGFGGQMKNCDTRISCPIDGGWTAWVAWKCTVTCGGGDGKQKRTCNNPKPKHGGKVCDGPSEEEGKCNTQKCPDQVYTLSPMIAQELTKAIDSDNYNFQENKGGTVRIPCSETVITKIYEEYPFTSLIWTKNGQIVKIDHERMIVMPTELTIQKLIPEDNGIYVCSIHYASQLVRPVTISAVAVVSPTPDIEVHAEESMKLVCHGAELGKIYKNSTQVWLLNGNVYKDFGSSSPTKHSVYEVHDIQLNMTGTWTCKIRDPLTSREWTTNVISVKVLPARWKIIKFLSNRNVILAIVIILFILIMLVGTIFGYIIIKVREEFMAEFEKWTQIVEWEEIRAGGVPKWVREMETLDVMDEEEISNNEEETDNET